MAESWLPLVSTTCAPASVSRTRASSRRRDDVDPRQGTVVDVAGDQDDVHLFRADEVDQLVDEALLGVQHADAVERPAQVPIGSVQ